MLLCFQVVAKPLSVVVCVCADFDTICEAANVSVSEEEASSPRLDGYMCCVAVAVRSFCILPTLMCVTLASL